MHLGAPPPSTYALDIAEQERVVEGIGSVLVRVPGDQLQGMISAVSDPPLTAVRVACYNIRHSGHI